MTPNQQLGIDASERKRIIGILLATVILWVTVIGVLARGGRPDPPGLRAAATILDGTWRFNIGDDPHWADANTDDSGWETIDLTAPPGSHDGDVGLPDYVGGWMAHGHPGYTGYAWYRRGVTVPAGHALWSILGPTLVEDGYEIYWNGNSWAGREGWEQIRGWSAPVRCDSPFQLMRPVPAAWSPSARSCVRNPRPPRTGAGCTARLYWRPGRSVMRFTGFNGNAPLRDTSSMRSSRSRCSHSSA